MELIKICSVIDYRWRTHDAIAECVTDVLSTFWRQHKIYLFYIIKKHTIISRSFNITRKPAFTHFGVICNLTMLSIQNEAMQSVAVRSKELRLVQENLITPLPNLTRIAPRGMKTYSESRTELHNPQILKKMLGKSRQFLSSEPPCEPKILDDALNTAGVEKIRLKNLQLRSTLKAIRFEFWIKGALVTVEICTLCGWWFSNQCDIVSETLYSWPWAVVSYTLLAAAPWKGLEHSCRKARLCVYFNWF